MDVLMDDFNRLQNELEQIRQDIRAREDDMNWVRNFFVKKRDIIQPAPIEVQQAYAYRQYAGQIEHAMIRRSVAEERALNLLMDHLSPEQNREFRQSRVPVRWRHTLTWQPLSRLAPVDPHPAWATGYGSINPFVKIWQAFSVTGNATGIHYLIYGGTHANILAVTPCGSPWFWLCCQLNDGEPLFDVMLAQKLALESNERYLLSVANAFI